MAAVTVASTSGAIRMAATHHRPGRLQAKHSPWLPCGYKAVGHPPILQTCFMCKVCLSSCNIALTAESLISSRQHLCL